MGSLLDSGKAIIDPGATSTVGSVDAMSRVLTINDEQGHHVDVEIDPTERPIASDLETTDALHACQRPSCQFLSEEV